METNRTIIAAYIMAGLLIVNGLTGCAAVDQKISLNYTRHNDSLVKHSGDITVSYVESKPVAKNRAGEWIIGSLNNVNGVHQADLLSDRSIGEWVSEAVIQELKQIGYTVSSTSSLPAADARGIVISDISELLNSNKGALSTATRHELKLHATVYLNGIKTKTFTVASRVDKTLPLNASKEDLEKIMLHSLQDAMLQVIPDIIVLIDKK